MALKCARLCIAFLSMTAPLTAQDFAATFPVDPVELLRGNEANGNKDIAAMHYRYRYLFVNEQNRATFLEAPEKYEIQLGGACGRMGALSGLGTTFYYATHENKLYIFASKSCKETFLKNPDRVLDTPDLIPTGTPEAVSRGRALIDQAVAAAGGAAAVDALKTYRSTTRRNTTWREETHETVDMRTVDLTTLSFRQDQTWGDDIRTLIVTPQAGWRSSPKSNYALHAQQCSAARKIYIGRNILAILQGRTRPEFVAVYQGGMSLEHKGAHMNLEQVAVHWAGATSVLGIDPDSGRIVTMSYRGQGPNMMFGQSTRVYTSYFENAGVQIPQWYDFKFEGADHDIPPVDQRRLTLNVQLTDTFFERPPQPVSTP